MRKHFANERGEALKGRLVLNYRDNSNGIDSETQEHKKQQFIGKIENYNHRCGESSVRGIVLPQFLLHCFSSKGEQNWRQRLRAQGFRLPLPASACV